MKLVRFSDGGNGAKAGAMYGEDFLVDLSVAAPELPAEMKEILGQGDEGLGRMAEAIASGLGRVPIGDVSLLPPVLPGKFFGIGLNYADHVAESKLDPPERLIVFAKAVSCVVGPHEKVERPAVSEQLDYEGELAVVIGRRCRHVSSARAPEVIAGYTIVNDFSVRDWQTMTPQWSIGKSFDTHGPMGPAIVTADEIPNPHELGIRTWVNGRLRQDSNTAHLIYDCFDQIEILSQVCTLEPGDVIATGTPGGVAAAREGKPWLVPGDVVRVDIDRIGAIENEIVDEQLGDDQFLVGPHELGPRSRTA